MTTSNRRHSETHSNFTSVPGASQTSTEKVQVMRKLHCIQMRCYHMSVKINIAVILCSFHMLFKYGSMRCIILKCYIILMHK